MAVAGHTHSFNYTDTTKAFSLHFTPNIAIEQPTDIYLNEKLNYPNGYVQFMWLHLKLKQYQVQRASEPCINHLEYHTKPHLNLELTEFFHTNIYPNTSEIIFKPYVWRLFPMIPRYLHNFFEKERLVLFITSFSCYFGILCLE